jgi:ribosomal protein S18 acetylase RimI-like enzyme
MWSGTRYNRRRNMADTTRASLSDFRLRPATLADVPLILDFIRQLADYEGLLDRVTASEAVLSQTLFGAKPSAEVIIAESAAGVPGAPSASIESAAPTRETPGAGEPAGFAVFFHTYSTFEGRPGLYLEDLFVIPRWRGRGLGRRLIAELARIAVARGCARLEWSVLDWNEIALRVYRSVGARPLDEWTVQRLDGDALRALAAEAAPASAG